MKILRTVTRLCPPSHDIATELSPNFVTRSRPQTGLYRGPHWLQFHFHSARLTYKRTAFVYQSMLAPRTTREPQTRRRIDITDLSADSVDDYVRGQGGDAELSLERRGARTFLVVEE